ncbi:UvrB/UvrC motif-containing protein [Halanaerobium salsuginis]|jgi:protein arginine kinase activator|uniref:Protein-arginine kinase activator protein McsA n=1 Tax=Halanaerobium salsuginis TaxID=29563 RepID=A0A1I4MIG3_9FIRM|nr:UvrB/UvrC motif-containing protein [Halanaerobium salsuginis]SFM02823.1 Protein-arginine kinase activator protein McsA [Halanaerobium salsuginis]
MLCDNCHQNEAAVHLTRIINGKKEEIHLCEECAKDNAKLNTDQNDLSVQSLLAGILNNNFGFDQTKFYQQNTLEDRQSSSEFEVCPGCGLSYQEFASKGLFGCSQCFNTFSERLDNLFKRIHGNVRHSGKKVHYLKQQEATVIEINDLKAAMEKAVAVENFEKAAELRDKIHALQKNMEADGND